MNKYRTVSIVRPLADDVEDLMEEVGHWPSLGAFTREALIAKLHAERALIAIEGAEAEGVE